MHIYYFYLSTIKSINYKQIFLIMSKHTHTVNNFYAPDILTAILHITILDQGFFFQLKGSPIAYHRRQK